MKNFVVVCLLVIFSNASYAECEAVRRNSCWGFLSYRYKVSGSIMSFLPQSGCMCIVEFDGVERNCYGAFLWETRQASAYPGFFATVQGQSNANSLYDYVSVDDPAFLSAELRTISIIDNGNIPERLKRVYNQAGRDTKMEHKTEAGSWDIKKGQVNISSILLNQYNGKAANGKNISEISLYEDLEEKNILASKSSL